MYYYEKIIKEEFVMMNKYTFQIRRNNAFGGLITVFADCEVNARNTVKNIIEKDGRIIFNDKFDELILKKVRA